MRPRGLMGLMRLMGPIGPMRLMGPMGLMGLIGLMGLMGSCSGSEDPTPQVPVVPEVQESGDPITFGSSMEDAQSVTKATTRTTTPLHDKGVGSMRVYGYKNTAYDDDDGAYTAYQTVMDGYRLWWNTAVSASNPNGDWEYVGEEGIHGEVVLTAAQTIKFWDWSALAYRFMAVAPASALQSASVVGDATKSLRLTMNDVSVSDEDNMPYYSRLWYSTGSSVDFPNRQFGETVQLEFVKPLCHVRIMFTFEDPSKEATTTFTNISFSPGDGGIIEQSGDVSVVYPLTGTGLAETLEVSDATGLSAITEYYYETPNNAGARKWYAVLPATGQGVFTLAVSVNGEPKTTTVPANYMDWLPNYDYTYVFKVHVDGGVSIDSVKSAFAPWGTEHEGSHEVYNW